MLPVGGIGAAGVGGAGGLHIIAGAAGETFEMGGQHGGTLRKGGGEAGRFGRSPGVRIIDTCRWVRRRRGFLGRVVFGGSGGVSGHVSI